MYEELGCVPRAASSAAAQQHMHTVECGCVRPAAPSGPSPTSSAWAPRRSCSTSSVRCARRAPLGGSAPLRQPCDSRAPARSWSTASQGTTPPSTTCPRSEQRGHAGPPARPLPPSGPSCPAKRERMKCTLSIWPRLLSSVVADAREPQAHACGGSAYRSTARRNRCSSVLPCTPARKCAVQQWRLTGGGGGGFGRG